MKKLYELEMTRNNVTPRAFYSVVRRELLKKGGVELESWVGEDGYYAWMNPPTVCDAHSTENETICKKPFDFQIAYNGAYNVILEFQFDDDNRGTGYAYICEYEAEEQPAAAQEAANEPEADATETPDEYTEARKLRARAYELRLRAENLNNEGKLHDDFVRYVEKLELQASKAVSRAYVAKNPRLAAALEKAKAKQDEQAATETPDEPATPANQTESDSAEAGQPAPQEADVTAMAGKLTFLYSKHDEMMERAHDAERDSAEEANCLKSGDRLYKAIRNAEARLRDAGAEVRRTDGDYPYYHITGAVVKLDGRIIAAYPEENAAGKYVVTGQCRRDLARCETREEAETVKAKIGGYDIIPVEDYEPPEEDCDCAAWDFSRERIEELAAVVAEDVNDPDPEKEWDFDSIGALLAIAGFYGEREDAKMDACKSPEELDALLMEELREAERICNVKIFAAATDAAA